MPPPSFTAQNVRRFGREWWWEQVRTLFWVVVVTVLIWVYADMEFTQTRELVVNVRLVVSPKTDMAVLGRRDFTVTARTQGNRASLDAFENYLKANGDRLEIDVSAFKAGENEISAEDLLRRSPDLTKAGLTVSTPAADPVKFQLDRMVVRDVAVKFVYSGGKLAGEPVVTPAAVKVRLPSSQWERVVAAANGSAPVLPTETVSLDRKESNKPIHLTATLAAAIGDVPVQPTPAGVAVDLQVEHAVSTIQLKVPVQVVVPTGWVSGGEASFWREYRLVQQEAMEWRPTLNIAGSAKDLEALKARQDEIHAFIELTENDKLPTGSWIQRKPSVMFPRDLDVRLQDAPPTLQFRLEKTSN